MDQSRDYLAWGIGLVFGFLDDFLKVGEYLDIFITFIRLTSQL